MPKLTVIDPPRTLRIALIGNPNTGKTSLFNALTGFRRHVANYPGVTVECARGPVRGAARPIELLDLPGTYSLAARSPDEMLVNDALTGRLDGDKPDAILAIVDATNLRRNLYLVSQLIELGLPLVLAVNMVDIAERRGVRIQFSQLAQQLGVPVIPVIATKPATVAPLVHALATIDKQSASANKAELPCALCTAACSLEHGRSHAAQPEPLSLRVLLDQGGEAEKQYLARGGSREKLDAARAELTAAGIDGPTVEVQARYAWVARMLEGVVAQSANGRTTWSQRLDFVLTHKLFGAMALVLVFYVVFSAIFAWATPLMDWIDSGFSWVAATVSPLLPEGALRSFVTDGVIAGVGGVLVFLPQILILFALIALLEDCGYLARAAHMMDRLMGGLGLSGRSFIPLLSSFACAVPAIMGTRTIADRRERFATILIAPFMSCSARLPVYLLMIGAFIEERRYLGGWLSRQALVLLAMYLVGVVVAIPFAWLLRASAFRGPAGGFMLELPSYKWPRLGAVWQRMSGAGRKFVVNAGTIILTVNLVVWALGYFPRSAETRAAVEQRQLAESWDEARFDKELAGAYLRDSYLGRMGHWIEPVVKPLGWDWRIGVAVIASFPAREVVVATLGSIYNLGEDDLAEGENSASLRGALRSAVWPDSGAPVFTVPVAVSLMVFFALCAQCSSTLVVIGRETGTWKWPVASFVFMTLIAYVGAWVTTLILGGA